MTGATGASADRVPGPGIPVSVVVSAGPARRWAASAALAAPAPAVELVAAPQRVQNRNIPLTGDPHLVQNLIGVSPA